MYVSVSRLRVEEARAEELAAAFRCRAHLVDAFDGFVDLEVWHSDRDPSELLMVSRWRDREAFKRYMASREHRISHERIDEDLKRAITLERLEHLHAGDIHTGDLQTYEVVAR